MRLALTLALFTFIGCDVHQVALDTTETRQGELTNAEYAQQIVEGLPNWVTTDSTNPFSAADIDGYMLAAIQLQSLPAPDVRAGVKAALETQSAFYESRLVHANTFVLLRLLFAVPHMVATSTTPIRSAYAAFAAYAIMGSNNYPLAWPVEFNADGTASTIMFFMGARGGSHDALEEYDAFETAYPHRSIPSCDSRCGTYSPTEACQCDSACGSYGDCCVDYAWRCGPSSASAATSAASTTSRGRPTQPLNQSR